MSEMTVTALVLRRRDLGESDRKLTILTPEQGKIDVVAKGARKPASRLASVSDPLSHSVLSIATGRAMGYITQAQPLAQIGQFRNDYSRLLAALSLAELAASVIPYHEPSEATFGMVVGALTAIAMHTDVNVAAVWGQLKLMEEAGFLPSFETCVVTGEQIGETYGYLAPSMGGFVSGHHSDASGDRYLVRAEALIGLAKTSELATPPPRLKFSEECLEALLPVWRHITESNLPATVNFVQSIRQQ